MDYLSALVALVISLLALPVVMTVLRRLPGLKHEPDSEKSYTDLAKLYFRWDIFSLFAAVAIIFITSLLFWQAISLLAELRFAGLNQADFLVSLPRISWFIPTLFLAILFSALPMRLLLKRRLGEHRYAEYIEYGRQQLGLDSWKLYRWICAIFIPLIVIALLLGLDCYFRVDRQGIIFNDFFGIGAQTYQYQQVESVQYVLASRAANGDMVKIPYYRITFDDANEFNFYRPWHDTDLARQESIAEAVVVNAAIEIQRVDLYPR